MQRISDKNPGIFTDRKVTIDQAVKILRNNGITTNEEQAKEILDFLYLIAKMHRDQSSQDASFKNILPEGDIEHQTSF